MIIESLKTNHIETPLGYQIARPVFSWTVSSATGKRQASARVKVAADAAMSEILFDTGERDDLTSLGVPVDLALAPRTRYFWQVSVTADDGEKGLSPVSWFETGKMDEPFLAKWIAAPFDGHPVLSKEFVVGSAPAGDSAADLTSAGTTPAKTVAAARLYICGLGLYEAYLDGEKIGSEHLAPGYDSYQYQIQLQTYDVTGALLASGDAGAHTLSVMLGKGWYMGRYGFGQEIANIYGDRMQLLAELHIAYEDGTSDVIASDESWLCTPSPVVEANLYDGEIYDARVKAFSTENAVPAVAVPAPQGGLIDRIGLPVEVQESWSEYDLIKTPAGELVLDFHQNLAGFVTFTCDLPAGEQVYLQFGELLQDGCFYRDNLRTAKAEYTYISSGEKSFVRPIFTFYGFRYVKVQGLTEEQIRAACFTVCAIWSALEATGSLTTSDPGLNRLILNALWSQRGNFVDIPTDCPQRDERMGWTGDAQAFSETASLFMYTPVFYAKYLSDMLYEQKTLGGSVPFVVPVRRARCPDAARRRRHGPDEPGGRLLRLGRRGDRHSVESVPLLRRRGAARADVSQHEALDGLYPPRGRDELRRPAALAVRVPFRGLAQPRQSGQIEPDGRHRRVLRRDLLLLPVGFLHRERRACPRGLRFKPSRGESEGRPHRGRI